MVVCSKTVVTFKSGVYSKTGMYSTVCYKTGVFSQAGLLIVHSKTGNVFQSRCVLYNWRTLVSAKIGFCSQAGMCSKTVVCAQKGVC
jgi:hypothetical protein